MGFISLYGFALFPEWFTLPHQSAFQKKRNTPLIIPQRYEEKLHAFKSMISKSGAKLSDTEVYFAAGDFAAAYLTAEFFGIAINGAACVLAVGGRIYEAVANRKPMGLGFYSMSVVSAVTTVSIVANSFEKYSWDFIRLTQPGPRELFFAAAAFAAWTVANAVAGYKKAKQSSSGSPVANHQTYFCLGSIFATHAKIVPLLFFIAGFVKILGRKPEVNKVKTWNGLYEKHATPQRLRAIAYAASALGAAFADPRYVLPYLLWMMGNFVFDAGELDKSFKRDLFVLIRKPAPPE
ncbi:MAG: hypothetical protein V1721_02585 [Pseudomonadota bacterium]